MKTSAVAVRSVLRDGLENPSRYQTARTGLAALKAVKLYRDGRKEDTSRFAPSPEGDAPGGPAKPVPRVHWHGPRPLHGLLSGSGEAGWIKIGATEDEGHRFLRLGLVGAGLQRRQAQGGGGLYGQFQLLP